MPAGLRRLLGNLSALCWRKSFGAGLAALAGPQLTQRHGRRVLLARGFGRGVVRYLARGNLDRPKGRYVHIARFTLRVAHTGYSNAGKHKRQGETKRITWPS